MKKCMICVYSRVLVIGVFTVSVVTADAILASSTAEARPRPASKAKKKFKANKTFGLGFKFRGAGLGRHRGSLLGKSGPASLGGAVQGQAARALRALTAAATLRAPGYRRHRCAHTTRASRS